MTKKPNRQIELSARSKLLARRMTVLVALAAVSAPAVSESTSVVPPYMKEFDAFKGKTVEGKIQELTDREEIRELIARYAQRVAHRQSFSDLFTEDGVYVNHYAKNPLDLRGRRNIAAFFDSPTRSTNGQSDALPMIHNVVIEITGDEAVGICSNELRITENGKSIIASGYYRDRYRRENGHWKFALRETTWFHWVGLREGWAESAVTK